MIQPPQPSPGQAQRKGRDTGLTATQAKEGTTLENGLTLLL